MFVGEIAAGIASGSQALQADALDFLGDAANYAISLGIAGMALRSRSRAAVVKGATIFAFGGYVLLTTIAAALDGGYRMRRRWHCCRRRWHSPAIGASP